MKTSKGSANLNDMKTIIITLWFMLISFTGISVLGAQENQNTQNRIHDIYVMYENFKTVDRAFVLSNILLQKGAPYTRSLSDQSIRALYKTAYFEFVDIKVVQALDEQVDVYVYLTSKYKLGAITIEGNESISSDRIMEISELSEALFLDEYAIDLGAKKIKASYHEKGYPDANIRYRINRNEDTGFASIIFEVQEKEKTYIQSIEFEGVSAFKTKTLKQIMQTKEKDLFSWLSGNGKFEKAVLIEDINRIESFYQNAGFLDVTIEKESVRFDFSNNTKTKIIIPVSEGEQYFLGTVSIEGNTIFTEGELLLNSNIVEGMVFSSQKISDFSSQIRDFYTSRGYLETRVLADKQPNVLNRRIDVIYKVRESEKYYLESISVEGNTKSKQQVIIRELALRPGDVFDYKRMESSQMRLRNTNFFDTVRLTPETSNIPGRKNLNILVSESRTGALSFGAGFGSVSSTQFFLEMKQSNFDINNWRSGFQGDGQKFRLRLSIGSLSSQALVSFEEPWLFEQRVALGTSLYNTESEYNSSDYNETRSGFEIYIRRRLFELVEAKLSYNYELVDIYDVPAQLIPGQSDGIADVFQEGVGEESVSKIGLTLLRDNRNELIFTRSGNRSSLVIEYAGLGGNVDYFKTDLRIAQFIPTFDFWKQSVSLVGRLGVIMPLGDDETAPFYDRFYLGGPETLRGYDYRDVGPRSPDGELESDESAGGHTYGLFSAEYLFHVADSLGFVAFYDGGFVNENENDFSFDLYADNIGFGVRFLMLGSPLKLDYGVPINTPDGVASDPQFNFSFGSRY